MFRHFALVFTGEYTFAHEDLVQQILPSPFLRFSFHDDLDRLRENGGHKQTLKHRSYVAEARGRHATLAETLKDIIELPPAFGVVIQASLLPRCLFGGTGNTFNYVLRLVEKRILRTRRKAVDMTKALLQMVEALKQRA